MPARCIRIHRSDREETRSGNTHTPGLNIERGARVARHHQSGTTLNSNVAARYLIMRDDAIIDTEPQKKAAKSGAKKKVANPKFNSICIIKARAGISSRQQQEGSPTDWPD